MNRKILCFILCLVIGMPAMTFVASANAVEHAGATPVLVDCEPLTGLIDDS